MFGKLTYLFCLLWISTPLFPTAAAENPHKPLAQFSYSPRLQEAVLLIYRLPEARTLITKIRQQGPLCIYASEDNEVSREFGACWDPVRRIVFVDTPSHGSTGALIGSILFELHNALRNSTFQYYDTLASKGEIAEERYVRCIEYLEYQNSLNTSRMAKRGITLGIFPTDALLPTYESFETYYYYQRIGGHSAQIAENYRSIAPENPA